MFITLSIVYIQISNTYLREFLIILLYAKVNPVRMCTKCLYSVVIFNSKLNYYGRYRFWNVVLNKPLTAENDTKMHFTFVRCFSFIHLQFALYTWERRWTLFNLIFMPHYIFQLKVICEFYFQRHTACFPVFYLQSVSCWLPINNNWNNYFSKGIENSDFSTQNNNS